MITIVKADLFSAPKGSILIHSCNTQGVWGAGIAKQFAEKFPDAFEIYQNICRLSRGSLIGHCILIQANKDYTIACLFTSNGYGSNVDSPEQVLHNTELAIKDMLLQNIDRKPYHMPKINSGLFNTPWVQTQKVLDLAFPKEEFTVYEYST